jgi:hypothetical protein
VGPQRLQPAIACRYGNARGWIALHVDERICTLELAGGAHHA